MVIYHSFICKVFTFTAVSTKLIHF